jgi:hypothetical protein
MVSICGISMISKSKKICHSDLFGAKLRSLHRYLKLLIFSVSRIGNLHVFRLVAGDESDWPIHHTDHRDVLPRSEVHGCPVIQNPIQLQPWTIIESVNCRDRGVKVRWKFPRWLGFGCCGFLDNTRLEDP